MEATVLAIGGCHGDKVDKFAEISGISGVSWSEVRARCDDSAPSLPKKTKVIQRAPAGPPEVAGACPSSVRAFFMDVDGGCLLSSAGGRDSVEVGPPSSCTQPCPHLSAVEGCAAYMLCTVQEMTSLKGHWLCTCTVEEAVVAKTWEVSACVLARPVSVEVCVRATGIGLANCSSQ
jgi:hypothetical protein